SQSSADPQRWVALKTRFFAQVLSSEGTQTEGFIVTANRSQEQGPLTVQSVSAQMLLPTISLPPGGSVTRSYRLYIGPKKLSILRSFAENTAEIMEFGTFKWLCVILIPILNGLNAVFHNYGVAIIVLTIMVRLIFWPLTRKSNESMKKMGAIQPQLKAIQEKFKGDPQKLQQETMRLYRENHVNPMSSCLPMLIQIPVFIALFVVLRTATELRFAPFLWIRDLSEPENLLAGVIQGVPALNILPFLMAGTMFLQSKLTPSMGDPAQQKMMMWMMPLMMFFMFYSMPSALLLYWTVSQFLAIIQLMRQRKARAAAATVGADGVIEGEAVTRQERRRLEREGNAK
ncbi:MAG: YidC/Oxa1 family insertase periplasmic-domain containing protein, partial [Kiritimatiellae bacterium]|nr:YidC/Oxa1 family insertase periplasmic-domain containing protein [Kiritimatiellia bacterium]